MKSLEQLLNNIIKTANLLVCLYRGTRWVVFQNVMATFFKVSFGYEGIKNDILGRLLFHFLCVQNAENGISSK